MEKVEASESLSSGCLHSSEAQGLYQDRGLLNSSLEQGMRVASAPVTGPDGAGWRFPPASWLSGIPSL